MPAIVLGCLYSTFYDIFDAANIPPHAPIVHLLQLNWNSNDLISYTHHTPSGLRSSTIVSVYKMLIALGATSWVVGFTVAAFTALSGVCCLFLLLINILNKQPFNCESAGCVRIPSLLTAARCLNISSPDCAGQVQCFRAATLYDVQLPAVDAGDLSYGYGLL